MDKRCFQLYFLLQICCEIHATTRTDICTAEYKCVESESPTEEMIARLYRVERVWLLSSPLSSPIFTYRLPRKKRV